MIIFLHWPLAIWLSLVLAGHLDVSATGRTPPEGSQSSQTDNGVQGTELSSLMLAVPQRDLGRWEIGRKEFNLYIPGAGRPPWEGRQNSGSANGTHSEDRIFTDAGCRGSHLKAYSPSRWRHYFQRPWSLKKSNWRKQLTSGDL